MKYDTYLAYSRGVDKDLAEALESALNRFSKPFYGFGPSRVFSDRSEAGDNVYLPSSDLRQGLERAKYFILLASPESANSVTVESELSLWLKNRPIENLLIILTGGEITPARRDGDIDPEARALPLILTRAFKEEPLYIDLRWARDVKNFQERYQFMDAVAQISAVLQGVSKDSLLDRYARRSKRIRRSVYGVVVILVLLMLVATMTATFATRQVGLAQAAEQKAKLSREIAEREAQIAMQYRVESQKSAARAEELQQELERLRKTKTVTVVETNTSEVDPNPELERSLARAKDEAADYKRKYENTSQLADQYKQQYEGQTRLLTQVTQQQGQTQGNSYLREFIKQNHTMFISGVILFLMMLLFSTRLVLLILQLDIAILKPLAIGFFYSPLGRWKLYRKYKKRLSEDANIHYHAEHYVDLPFESSDDVGVVNTLESFLEESMKSRNVCIIAEGGRGKTTLAYKLALRSTNGQLMINNRSLIPVVVDGLTYDGNLVESITSALKQHRVYVNAVIVASQIAAGNILVIFDGWSEVREFYSEPEDESSDIPQLISGHPDTRFIFTSRSHLPATIRHALGNAATVKLKDLDEHTLDEFLEKYIERRKDQIATLAGELKDSPTQIPHTPLMIRLVAEIYDRTGQIPKDRISLFEQYVEKLLRPEIIERIDVAGLLYVIKHLVRHTYIATEGNRGFPIYKGVELLDQIKVMVGNFGIRLLPIDLLNLLSHAGLYKRSGEYLRFFHDSFESYFAARLLDDDFREGKYALLASCASNVRFIETIGFLVGMCKERNEQEKLVEVIEEARRITGIPADIIA